MDLENGFGKMNEVLADLYFDKDYEDTNTAEKLAIYGTYVAAGVILYFVDYPTLHDAIAGRTIENTIITAEQAAGDNADLEALFDKLFDTEFVWFLETIHGEMSPENLVNKVLEDVRIGDVVAAFTLLTDAEGWTYGAERLETTLRI